MPDDNRLIDLIVRWEELREEGQDVSAEILCRDCPELLPVLRERLKALDAVNVALGTDDLDQETVSWAGDPSEKPDDGHDEASAAAAGPEVEAIREIPGYKLLRELGRGGMGVVHLALHIREDRLVALKMLLPGRGASQTERTRFKAEVEAVGRLHHPNLIQIFEVGEHEGHAYFSMEYLEGGSLEEKIASGPLPPLEAAKLIAVLARAIHTAHQHGVIHRDLKPANVMLTSDGIPKIGDFGLAKLRNTKFGPTRTLHILGTPAYMAPEQAAGHSRTAGPGADIYALGAILYRMLTGRPPFVGKSDMMLLLLVAEKEPAPLRDLNPEIPVDLETICLKCLRKKPDESYTTAALLADDLDRFAEGKAIQAQPFAPAPSRHTDVPSKWRWLIVLSLIAVVVAFLVMIFAAGK